MAAEYSAALGRTITYVDVPLEQWRDQELRRRNLPDHVFEHLLTMARLHAANRYDRLTLPSAHRYPLMGVIWLNPLDSRVGFRSWVKRTGINEMKGEPFQDVFEHFVRESCGTTLALEFFEDDLQSADNVP